MSESFWTSSTTSYAALAIPAFFVFVGIEYAVSRATGRNIFTFERSVSNITVGIAERLLNLFLTASFYHVFEWIYAHWSIWNIPNTWYVWVLLLLATDFIWYWYHRLGHEVNIMWAAHVVHHQSEDYNYTVSARITTFQSLIRNVFWSVLPLAGFHPNMVVAILIVHGTYSFFTHTQLIGNLGWFEYILITPSHHRVHHASDEKYLNKNYGDIFIFWDKLFGTFQREEEEPTYGLTQPLMSYSFIWQHFHYFFEIFYAVSVTPGFSNKLKILFGRPESLDGTIRNKLEDKFIPAASVTNTSRRFKTYLIVQIFAVVTLLFVVALNYSASGIAANVAASLFIILTLVNCGALLQQRRWIYYLEYLRLFVITSFVCLMMGSPLAFIVTTSFIILSAESKLLRNHYLRFVYGN